MERFKTFEAYRDAVKAAVEKQPGLCADAIVNHKGEVCPVGALVYEMCPDLRVQVDALRLNPVEDEPGDLEDEMYVADHLLAPFKGARAAITEVNDEIVGTPETRRASFLTYSDRIIAHPTVTPDGC